MADVLTVPHDGEWTVDDLDDLPEDGLRYELVEGTLLVSPPAPLPHQRTASRLLLALAGVLPPEWEPVVEGAVELDRRNLRVPDVLVVRRDSRPSTHGRPADVLLAVEVMSPSSVSQDRLVKPAHYAAAGIPHYWRLEPRGPVLATHVLEGGTYRETGRYDDLVRTTEPVVLEVRLSDLLP